MPRTLLLALVAFVPAPATAADPGKAAPYSFLVATGPERGQPTCFVCEQADKPTAVVFARTLSDPLAKLLGRLDEVTAARKDAGFKAWMTLLTPTADLDGLAKWSQKHALKAVPVGAFEDADGPPAYKLAAAADVTVVLFVNRKIAARFAFAAGDLTAAKLDEVAKAAAALSPAK